MKAVKSSALGLLASLSAVVAHADNGGLSFWLPGQFGALAAVPTDAGWSLPLIYYHARAKDDANTPVPRGGLTTLGLEAQADILFAFPTYTFGAPVLGAQVAGSVGAAVARSQGNVDLTLEGPRGHTVSGGTQDSLKGASDVFMMGTMKWSHGVHNFVVYSMGNLPVGAYDSDRLVNIGLGHDALDVGAGYTWFDTKNELSAVTGVTYNWENSDIDYQNGIDAHLDLSASHFFTEQTHLGVVGYVFLQVTGDSGEGANFGDFKSRVYGVGPQAGHFFKIGEDLWYINLKGYHEFDAKHRAQGWNAWLTLSIPFSSNRRAEQ